MNFITDPLFQAVFDTAFPRVILSATPPDFLIVECNGAANALFNVKKIKNDRLTFRLLIETLNATGSIKKALQEACVKAKKDYRQILSRLLADVSSWTDTGEAQEWQFELVPIPDRDNSLTYLLLNLSQIQSAQNLSEELNATSEELYASNEELSTIVEALSNAKDSLRDSNDQLEHRVTERTEKLRNIIANLPAGVCILKGPEFVLEDVNDGMLRIWDRDESILGKKLLDFMPELEGQAFPALLANVYNTGITYIERDAPVEINMNNGKKTVFLDFSYTPLINTSQQVDRILVHANDVTDRTVARLREQQLSEELSVINEELSSSNEELAATNDALSNSQAVLKGSETTLKFMFNAIPQQVWTCLPNGSLNYVNQIMCDDFEKDMETLVQQGWRQFIHPDDLLNTAEKWALAFQTSEALTAEFRLRLNDGKYYWHLARAVPMIDNSETKLWIGTNTNIELQKANEQKKDEFLSIASHELKTPLTNIKAFNQLISRMKDPEKVQYFSKKSAAHIDKLEWLISDLLDVTKINAGKMAYNMQPLNFRELILNSIETIQQTTTTHEIILEGDADIIFSGDHFRLEQVMQNFLSNAIKYSPKATKVIVNYAVEMDNILVSIQDFGIGIAEKDFNKLFDRYYRADNSAMHFEGIGLGLYISSEILKRHQGSFWIESQKGIGSTFFFRLPIDQSKHNEYEINQEDFYKNKAVTIIYNDAEQRLDADWTGFQDLGTVQHGCLKLHEMLSRFKVTKILNDNSHVQGTWSDASDWVGAVWFPMMEQAGLRQFAWVYSPAAFSQLSAQKAVELSYGSVTTHFFTDINLASAWIEKPGD